MQLLSGTVPAGRFQQASGLAGETLPGVTFFSAILVPKKSLGLDNRWQNPSRKVRRIRLRGTPITHPFHSFFSVSLCLSLCLSLSSCTCIHCTSSDSRVFVHGLCQYRANSFSLSLSLSLSEVTLSRSRLAIIMLIRRNKTWKLCLLSLSLPSYVRRPISPRFIPVSPIPYSSISFLFFSFLFFSFSPSTVFCPPDQRSFSLLLVAPASYEVPLLLLNGISRLAGSAGSIFIGLNWRGLRSGECGWTRLDRRRRRRRRRDRRASVTMVMSPRFL